MATTEQQGGEPGILVDTPNLKVLTEHKAGTLVASTAGRIDALNARVFQDAMESLLVDDVAGLVLDLKDLSYISSSGLRVIQHIARQMQSKTSKFGVCSLSDSVREVFRITGFDKMIQTHVTQADALVALSS